MDKGSRLVVVLLCFTALQGILVAFPTGGPMTLCNDPYPHHGVSRSLEPTPYSIAISAIEYNPGDNITVTISSSSTEIKGFQIGAHSVDGLWEKLYGEFSTFPVNASAYNYYSEVTNCISHSVNFTKTKQIEFTWVAPDASVGDLIFSATVLEDMQNFWVNHTAVLKAVQPAAAGAVTPALQFGASDFMSELDLSQCGTASGCITHPKGCTANTCNFAVSYVPVTDGIRFRLLNKKAPGSQSYVGMGISSDQRMRLDETFICMDLAGSLDFAHGFNPDMFNIKVQSDQVTDIAIESVDGAISCEFTRKLQGSFTWFGAEGAVVHTVDFTSSLETPEYHLYISWGTSYQGAKESVQKHGQLPIVSQSKVAFNKKSRSHFYYLHDSVKVHATFMVIAWCGAAAIAMIISRYYKDGFLNAKDIICGTKPWFQAHRGLAILAVLLTAISFIVIFVHYMGLTQSQILHAGFGITVMILTILQAIMGMARPDGDAGKKRTVFNWLHRLTGFLTYILAAVTMLVGTNISFMSENMKVNGTGLIAGMIAIQVLTAILLEMSRGCGGNSNKYAVNGNTNGSSNGTLSMEEPNAKNTSNTASHTKSMSIFVLYIMLMISLLITFLTVLWIE